MKKKSYLFIWAAAALFAVCFRLYEMLALTDYETGFIKSGSYIASLVLTLIFIVVSVFVAAFLSFNSKAKEGSSSFSITTSLAALALGATLIITSFTGNFVAVPGVIKTADVLFGVLSGVFFIAFAVRPVFHFPFSSKLLVLPLAFLTVKSAAVFIKTSYHAVIHDTIFDVGSYCFLMLLFLELARAANGFGQKNSLRKITFFSVLSSAFLIPASVPKLVLFVFFPSALHDGAGESMLFLFFWIFVISLLFSRIDFNSQSDRKMGVYYVGKH